MVPTKKNRGTNFREDEKSVLISLIKKSKNKVKTRKSKNENKNITKDEWNLIYEEFKILMGGNTERTLRQIKIFWKNYCAKRKKEEDSLLEKSKNVKPIFNSSYEDPDLAKRDTSYQSFFDSYIQRSLSFNKQINEKPHFIIE